MVYRDYLNNRKDAVYVKRKLLLTMAFLLFMMAGNSCYAMDNPAKTLAIYGGSGESAGQETPAVKKAAGIIADHTCIKLNQIPLKWIEKAKADLHIAYGHTSHGSQITEGLLELTNFKKSPYIYKTGLRKDSLDLRDNPFGGWKDLGNPDHKTWAAETRKYLKENMDINVVMWSWCGQLSNAGFDYVQNYLDLMQSLEADFPNVTFVYMTGHLDGTGTAGTLAQNNKRIRDFCLSGNKVLFDFTDIESYDPDGIFYGDKYANDACEYDSNGDKAPDKNWAVEWQDSHKKDTDWYQCSSAHSQPVNANMKAYAMWWLLAEIAGWDGELTDSDGGNVNENMSFEFYAQKLQSLNLLKGTDMGFELQRVPTRLEGAAMLTRLLGGEQEASSKLYSHPFRDAEKTWGNHYVGYLYKYNVTEGISANKFGCDRRLDTASYVTFLLRILGYSDKLQNGDFSWSGSLEAARVFGFISTDYYSVLKNDSFNRGHMAKLTYLCLNQKLKDNSMTLLEKLIHENAVDKNAAELF